MFTNSPFLSVMLLYKREVVNTVDENTKTMTARMDWYLQAVYEALQQQGYSPVDQIVGYLLTGDPTYITSHHHARCLAARIDREQFLHLALEKYLKQLPASQLEMSYPNG
jgi:uncharacterized protein (UPF0297 family)